MPLLNDYEKTIYDYIIGMIKEKYPNLGIYPGTPFNDLVATPLVDLLQPLVGLIDRIDINQNLANADIMDPDDLDALAEGNYFISRNRGVKANGYVYISFQRDPGDTSPITIPAGTVVSAGGDLKFIVKEDLTVTTQDLPQYYNVFKLQYDIPVYVEAEDVGATYNVTEKQIDTLESVISKAVAVSNKIPFSNGKHEETNKEFADRIRVSYLGRKLGTKLGYMQFVLENFDQVVDSLAVGFGDDAMKRDVLKDSSGEVVNDDKGNPVHRGGCTDIYIRGSLPEQTTASFRINSTYTYLEKTPVDLTSTILASNLTKPDTVLTFSYAQVDDGDKKPIKVNVSAGAAAYDTIGISYKYIDSADGISKPYTQTFVYMSDKLVVPNAPLLNIIEVVNKDEANISDSGDQPIDTSITAYTITRREGYENSPREGATITFAPATTRPNTASSTRTLPNGDTQMFANVATYYGGDLIEVTYTYDRLVNDVQGKFDSEEFRIITTDVLVRQAHKNYIYCQVKVKLKSGYVLGIQEKEIMRQNITDYINAVKFGGDIEASDIISNLYTLSNSSGGQLPVFTDYVETPIILYGLKVQESSIRTSNGQILYDGDLAPTDVTVYSTKIDLASDEYPIPYRIDIVEAGV